MNTYHRRRPQIHVNSNNQLSSNYDLSDMMLIEIQIVAINI